jgi:lysozyme
MKMSTESRRDLLQKFEGCKLKAYKCPAGIWTIGYGHTSAAGNPEVTEGLVITQNEAENILAKDLYSFERGVLACVKVSLSQHQFDVLVDFAYNAGLGALQKSTLLKKINASDFDAVPAELMKWTKGGGKELPGLVRRRQAEIALWSKVETHSVEEPDHRAEPDAPPAKTMLDSKQGNAALATTAIGGLSAAKEVTAQVQDASDLMGTITGLLHNQNFLLMVGLVGLGCAIWYWRKQHMDATGQ